MTIHTHYNVSIVNATTYGTKSDYARASISKTEYNADGEMISSSYVVDIPVEKDELTQDEAKMLFYAFKREAKVISTINDIL